MAMIRVGLYLSALAVLVASGYLVNVRHDRSRRPMGLAAVGLLLCAVIVWLEAHGG